MRFPVNGNIAKIVDVSLAPMLTPEYIAENDKATEFVEIEFNDDVFTVEVKRGVPIAVDIRRMDISKKIPIDDKMSENDRLKALENRTNYIRRLLVAEMLVNPQFSFEGTGEGTPIEQVSETLLQVLYNAHLVVNDPNSIVYKQARMTESDDAEETEETPTNDAPEEAPADDLVDTSEGNEKEETKE